MEKYLRFCSVVIKNEFTAIRGRGFRSVIYLSAILYLTFLCIGFANNALIYQQKLAGNPLSNWINIEISKQTMDSTESLINDLSADDIKNRYFVRNLFYSKEFGASFLDRTGICTGLPMPKAITTDPGSSIIHDLFNNNSIVRPDNSASVFRQEPFGFVVTGSFLKRLGFHHDSVTCLSYRLYGSKFVPVPLVGVVKELPNHADLLCTDAFYMMQLGNYPEDCLFSRLFIDTRIPGAAKRLKGVIRRELKIANEIPLTDSLKGFDKTLFVIFFPNNLPVTRMLFRDNLRLLSRMKEFRDVHFGKFYEVRNEMIPPRTSGDQPQKRTFNFDYLAVEFNRLDRLREFSDYIKNRYGISINMETVIQRQNYLYSLNISLGAIILVMTLALLSIVIFITDVLKNHLDRVKRNLGNFLAFGTSMRKITWIYIYVVMKILLVSIAIALLLAYLSGELFEKYLLKRILILDGDQDFFSLFNFRLPVFILVVLFVAVLKTLVTVMLLVRRSPGDLIYEREH